MRIEVSVRSFDGQNIVFDETHIRAFRCYERLSGLEPSLDRTANELISRTPGLPNFVSEFDTIACDHDLGTISRRTVSSPSYYMRLLIAESSATEYLFQNDVIGLFINLKIDTNSIEDSEDVENDDHMARFFRGVILKTSIRRGNSIGGNRLEICAYPPFWAMSVSQKSRVWKQASGFSVLQDLKTEYENEFSNFSQISDRRLGPDDNEIRECVIQWQETDFEFLSRLLERDGQYYFYTHDSDRSVLILMTSEQPPPTDVKNGEIELKFESNRDGNHSLFSKTLFAVERESRLIARQYSAADYNPLNAGVPLSFSTQTSDGQNTALEVYDYPADAGSVTSLEAAAIRRNKSIENRRDFHIICSKSPLVTPGLSVKAELEIASLDYAALRPTQVIHELFRSEKNDEFNYFNWFEAIPADSGYAPMVRTPIPSLAGTHNAEVVVRNGLNADVDDKSRALVVFRWDRAKVPVRVRLGQPWAGGKHGISALPRDGDEVLISFIQGNTERPVIVTSLHNSETKKKFDPMKSEALGLQGDSNPGAQRSQQLTTAIHNSHGNAILFNEAAGDEIVKIDAAKDFMLEIGSKTYNGSKKSIELDPNLISFSANYTNQDQSSDNFFWARRNPYIDPDTSKFTTLASALGADDEEINVADASQFPAKGVVFVRVDDTTVELIEYKNKILNSLTDVTRGFANTSAAGHLTGALIGQYSFSTGFQYLEYVEDGTAELSINSADNNNIAVTPNEITPSTEFANSHRWTAVTTGGKKRVKVSPALVKPFYFTLTGQAGATVTSGETQLLTLSLSALGSGVSVSETNSYSSQVDFEVACANERRAQFLAATRRRRRRYPSGGVKVNDVEVRVQFDLAWLDNPAAVLIRRFSFLKSGENQETFADIEAIPVSGDNTKVRFIRGSRRQDAAGDAVIFSQTTQIYTISLNSIGSDKGYIINLAGSTNTAGASNGLPASSNVKKLPVGANVFVEYKHGDMWRVGNNISLLSRGSEEGITHITFQTVDNHQPSELRVRGFCYPNLSLYEQDPSQVVGSFQRDKSKRGTGLVRTYGDLHIIVGKKIAEIDELRNDEGEFTGWQELEKSKNVLEDGDRGDFKMFAMGEMSQFAEAFYDSNYSPTHGNLYDATYKAETYVEGIGAQPIFSVASMTKGFNVNVGFPNFSFDAGPVTQGSLACGTEIDLGGTLSFKDLAIDVTLNGIAKVLDAEIDGMDHHFKTRFGTLEWSLTEEDIVIADAFNKSEYFSVDKVPGSIGAVRAAAIVLQGIITTAMMVFFARFSDIVSNAKKDDDDELKEYLKNELPNWSGALTILQWTFVAMVGVAGLVFVAFLVVRYKLQDGKQRAEQFADRVRGLGFPAKEYKNKTPFSVVEKNQYRASMTNMRKHLCREMTRKDDILKAEIETKIKKEKDELKESIRGVQKQTIKALEKQKKKISNVNANLLATNVRITKNQAKVNLLKSKLTQTDAEVEKVQAQVHSAFHSIVQVQTKLMAIK